MFEDLKGLGKSWLILVGLFLFLGSFAQDVHTTELKVLSKLTKLPIPGATVRISTGKNAFICDQDGKTQLKYLSGPEAVMLKITAVGFMETSYSLEKNQSTVTVELEQSIGNLDEIVVTGTRKAERLLSSPVSIEKYGPKAISETSGIDFFDGLKNLKGVDLVNSGLNYKQINSRGFAGTMNTRFLILIDGMDMLAPGLGWNLGNQFGTTELDIEDAELIPGAASALYGPTAFNGMLSMHTKDPFKSTGLSWMIKSGINHINDTETGIHGLNDVIIRYADKINEKFAFKFNIAYNNGLDWIANDYTDINVKTPINQRGANNPARDALNMYGDEIQKTIPGIGLVSRTGYEEKNLADYNVYGFKTNASLHYQLNKDLRLIYFQSFGIGNMNYTGSSRYSTNNYEFNTAKLELSGKNLHIRTYRVWENSNHYFNTRSLAQFINRTWVRDLNGNIASFEAADQTWFNRYEQAFKGQVSGVQGNDHLIARGFADKFRLLPGSAAFEEKKEYFKGQYAPNGSAILTKTSYVHTEGQYDITQLNKFVDASIGGSLRIYHLLSNGSLFNTAAKGITYKEFGMYIQIQKGLLHEKLKLTTSFRYDKNQNFNGSITPRFAMTIKANKNGYIRASIQTGFRNPTTVDQYVLLRSGLITLLGGAPGNSRGMTVYQNSYTSASVAQFTSAFNQSMANGTSYASSISSNLGLLKKATYGYIQPEKQNAFEIGYKTGIGNRLYLDLNAYYSQYTNFIVNANVVNTSSGILDANGNASYNAADDILSGKSSTYQLYTNSNASVSSYGISFGLMYKLPKGYEMSTNITHSKLNAASINTSLIAPFNTPGYSTNTSLSNSNLYHQIGFSLNWHWQSAFDWYGTFTGNNPGKIKAYSLLDFQLNKKFKEKKMMIKIGGNNILNKRVVQTYGSPAIGAIYYISFTHGIK